MLNYLPPVTMTVFFTKKLNLFCIFFCVSILIPKLLPAQIPLNSDSAFKAGTPNTGTIWGLVFGDAYYKPHADSLIRGTTNQYSGLPKNRNEFAFRRIYLGYDYNINKNFAVEILLAAEDNINFTSLNGTVTTSGDLLNDNKFSLFVKLANIRWKNIWKNTDIAIGQVATPSYALLIQKIWAYRSVERTISDIRRTPSFDMGATLQGKFGNKENYGYNLMVGNGTGARRENDNFKWFYADVYAKFFNKKIVVDIYADYQRLNWINGFHHSRNMVKGFVAYSTPALTIGLEAFVNHGKKDVIGISNVSKDTVNANATGISVFVHGDLIKNKLRFFARFDRFNPNTNYDSKVYNKYIGLTPSYEPNNKEQFFTAGLDFIPFKNINFIPNIWFNKYQATQTGVLNTDYDLVYRLTFSYLFGK